MFLEKVCNKAFVQNFRRDCGSGLPPKGGRKHPEQSLVHIRTHLYLKFICGGAFETLDKIIAQRVNQGGMGFGAVIKGKKNALGELFKKLEPDDLIRFGLIPELVGRLPVAVALEELDQKALLKILTEPKNALIKQYQKAF